MTMKPHMPHRGLDRLQVSMGHIGVAVSDLTASVDWYTRVLDMDVVFRNERAAYLTFDQACHRLVLFHSTEGRASPGMIDHFAFTMRSHQQLFQHVEDLKKSGITPRRGTDHGISLSIYYDDPDGTLVEFEVENYPTIDALNEWFAASDFAANPKGHDIHIGAAGDRILAGQPPLDVLSDTRVVSRTQ